MLWIHRKWYLRPAEKVFDRPTGATQACVAVIVAACDVVQVLESLWGCWAHSGSQPTKQNMTKH